MGKNWEENLFCIKLNLGPHTHLHLIPKTLQILYLITVPLKIWKVIPAENLLLMQLP